MEKINFKYFQKNIPTPTKTSNHLTLKEKIKSAIKRMGWKAHFYLRKDTSKIAYINYDFKTRNYQSQCKELRKFKKDLLDTIKLTKFRILKYPFQN